MLVKDLESRLFARFPVSDAEPWDHVGLSVGDPEAEAGRILVTLDATPPCVREGALLRGFSSVLGQTFYVRLSK